MRNKKKKRTRGSQNTRTSILFILAILVGLYCLMTFLVMPLYTRHWQRVHVPDVTNLSLSAAEKIIEHARLVPVRGVAKFDDAIPAGYVSFQNPGGDTFVKKGRRIYLISSKGKRPVTVPDLVGTDLRDARFTLIQSQLELGKISNDFDRYYPEGVVMEQAIEPGTEIMAGSALDITVSLGGESSELFIPDMHGKSLEEAEILLSKAHLVKGTVTYQDSGTSLPNHVISQSVRAGLRAAAGDTVDLVLSRMPKEGETEW